LAGSADGDLDTALSRAAKSERQLRVMIEHMPQLA